MSTAQVGDSSFDSDEWASVDEKISCGREQAAKGFQGLFLFHSVRLCPLLNHQVRAKKAKEGLIAFLRPTFTNGSTEQTFFIHRHVYSAQLPALTVILCVPDVAGGVQTPLKGGD